MLWFDSNQQFFFLFRAFSSKSFEWWCVHKAQALNEWMNFALLPIYERTSRTSVVHSTMVLFCPQEVTHLLRTSISNKPKPHLPCTIMLVEKVYIYAGISFFVADCSWIRNVPWYISSKYRSLLLYPGCVCKLNLNTGYWSIFYSISVNILKNSDIAMKAIVYTLCTQFWHLCIGIWWRHMRESGRP